MAVGVPVRVALRVALRDATCGLRLRLRLIHPHEDGRMVRKAIFALLLVGLDSMRMSREPALLARWAPEDPEALRDRGLRKRNPAPHRASERRRQIFYRRTTTVVHFQRARGAEPLEAAQARMQAVLVEHVLTQRAARREVLLAGGT